jgi:hypothetical protein
MDTAAVVAGGGADSVKAPVLVIALVTASPSSRTLAARSDRVLSRPKRQPWCSALRTFAAHAYDSAQRVIPFAPVTLSLSAAGRSHLEATDASAPTV